MPATGYCLAILECDQCKHETVYRGKDRSGAVDKALACGWIYTAGREFLCSQCAKRHRVKESLKCKFCGQTNGGCIACQGERRKTLKKSGMKIIK